MGKQTPAAEEQYACGEALRSQPKRIGDVVLRVLVFPAGTDTGVARGSLSVFLEAVPQPTWPRDWEFANIRYAIACIRWPSSAGEAWAAKKKSDLWTFKARRGFKRRKPLDAERRPRFGLFSSWFCLH